MTGPDTSLDDIRKEIDAIDDGLVDLLVRRVVAQRKVKARKSADGSLGVSPVRPAREAEILRRVVARGHENVPPELLVRLWRVILSTSALSQADIGVHTPKSVIQSVELARLLAFHFGPIPVVAHESSGAALRALTASPGDLCVVETGQDWASSLDQAGTARVIAVLPMLKNGVPPLLVFGHAAPRPTGQDCTLLVTAEMAPQPPGVPLWTARSGSRRVLCMGGFLDSAAVAAGTIIAGRFPDQIES
jgi:chorismate mutase